MLIEKYQSKWAGDFAKLKNVLVKANRDIEILVEHIGSTAIPGLSAKPIIDIDLVYYSKGDFISIKENLESIGYYHNGDQGIEGREVFKRQKKSDKHEVLDQVSHHLYVCHAENKELKKHLLFREILRKDKMLLREYEGLKRRLAVKANHDRKLYAKLKESEGADFFQSVLNQQNKSKQNESTIK